MESFPKTQRIHDQKLIEHLFDRGKIIRLDGMIVFWDSLSSSSTFRVMISVGKKRIRKAVNRNYIRRLYREALRRNKQEFIRYLETHSYCCSLIIVYTGDIPPSFPVINQKIILLLQRLQKEYEKDID